MGWRDLLDSQPSGEPHVEVFPWLGGRKIYRQGRTWKVDGALPREHGWYKFALTGARSARLLGPSNPDPEFGYGLSNRQGYIVGDRIIEVTARVDPDPVKFIEQTSPIFLVEPGLDRFTLVQAALDEESRFVFVQQLLPGAADDWVRWAFVEKKDSVDHIKDVHPALDLAFRFAVYQRKLLEERRAEFERKRAEERRQHELQEKLGTSLGRRTLAREDFEAGARAALAAGGAEYLDSRPGYSRNEMVVQYRFENRRLECVVDHNTLRIIDSGICLTDHQTGEKGDTYFTLESLPGVVREAINAHKLVVYRHADGADWRNEPDDDWDDQT